MAKHPEGGARKVPAKTESVIHDEDIALLVSALLPKAPDGIPSARMQKLQHPVGTAAAVDEAVNRLVARLAPDLSQHLATLEGRSFGEAGNSGFAKSLTRLIRRLGFCLECPCGSAAVALRFQWSGSTNVFKFEHTPSVRHGGTTTIPKLTLVSKSNDKA